MGLGGISQNFHFFPKFWNFVTLCLRWNLRIIPVVLEYYAWYLFMLFKRVVMRSYILVSHNLNSRNTICPCLFGVHVARVLPVVNSFEQP